MLDTSEPNTHARSEPERRHGIDLRLIVSLLLLGAAAVFTWQTIEGLAARRQLRADLAEIGHVRYGLLNATQWVQKITPILEANIAALDLKKDSAASLRPMVVNALYRLLDDVKRQMTAPKPPAPGGSPAGGGGVTAMANPFVVNMIVGALRPHVPEYADVVLSELTRPETKDAIRKYIKGVVADGARNTFGDTDMTAFNGILKLYGCSDTAGCRQEIGRRIQEADFRIFYRAGAVLLASALAFVLLTIGRQRTRRSASLVLLLFCVVLLAGGVLTPMLEVEAKISELKMTLLGTPIAFADQVLYFQSKSVLEVFRALIDTNRPDMWVVAILVLMFSIVFPIIKLFTSTIALYRPGLLKNRVARFFALESSKWSMADVMALAIFMAFVAFDGLIPNTMKGLQGSSAQLTIPTDSSKILPGYHLFIGFCIASLLVSRRLGRLLSRPGHSPGHPSLHR